MRGAADGPSVSSDLYSAIADRYDQSYDAASHRLVYDQLAWEHASAIALPPAAHVVDAGCGTGRWLPRWLERGHRVTAIEQAPGMLTVLAARGLGDGVTVLETAMEDASVPAGSADLVLAMGSVQYSADPAAMIRRFAGWARPGGSVCVYVDSLLSLVTELTRAGRHAEAAERLDTRRGVFRQGEHTASLALYDRDTLMRDLSAAGLVDIRCHGLAVLASLLGRDRCAADMGVDMDGFMARERALSMRPVMVDAGLHILAIGRRPV